MLTEKIYNLGISLYGLAIRQYAKVNSKAAKWVEGREDWETKLQQALHNLPADKPKIWVHVASLGEFEQGRPLISALRNKYPDYLIVLSFFSPSGYEIRKNYSEVDYVCYLPLDTPDNAFRFVHLLDPSIAIFIKYEFWYNYLTVLQHFGIPVFLVAARFRENQLFFRPWGRFFSKMIQLFEHITVQDQQSLKLLSKIHYPKASFSGDTRVDRVLDIATQPDAFPEIAAFCEGFKLLIFGSSWQADEQVFCPWLNKHLPPGWKAIIAPHEIGQENISRLQGMLEIPTITYSGISGVTAETRVLIIDNVGMLAHLYQFANIAYVGGGFGKSIHNILEPGAFGIPVIIGPNHQKFEEALALKRLGAVFSVKNRREYNQIMQTLSEEPIRREIKLILGQYFSAQRGATQKNIQVLAPYLE